jgi:hypothetical protein
VGGVLDVGGEYAIVRKLRDHLGEAPCSIVSRSLGLAVTPVRKLAAMTERSTLLYDLADRRGILGVFDPVEYDLGDRNLACHGLGSSFIVDRQGETHECWSHHFSVFLLSWTAELM